MNYAALIAQLFGLIQAVVPVAESTIGEVQSVISQIEGHPDHVATSTPAVTAAGAPST